MEQLIEFMEFEISGRGRKLNDNSVSVWYNQKAQHKTYGVTFACNIKTEKQNVKIGKIGEKLCFMFTNDPGINLNKSGSNVTFFSRGFVEHIFPKMNENSLQKDRIVYQLIAMGQDVYVVNE